MYVYLALYFLSLLDYQTSSDFNMNTFFFVFIAIYLAQYYRDNEKLLLKLFIGSGIIYLMLLIWFIFTGKGFALFYAESLNGRNYIGSVVTVLVITSFMLTSKSGYISGLFGLIMLLLLKFRTALLSLGVFSFLRYRKNKNFYIVVAVGLILLEMTLGIGSIIFKWGDSVSVTGGRTEPWIYYVNYIIDEMPDSLFPYIFRESNLPVYSYFSSETHGYHAPHNLVLDLLHRDGVLLGSVLLIFLLLPIFFSKSSTEKYAYIALFIFSLLEPSIGFSTNLISLLFYILLYRLYSEFHFVWGGVRHENITNA